MEVTFWDLAGSTEYRDIYKHLLPQSEVRLVGLPLRHNNNAAVIDKGQRSIECIKNESDCTSKD